MAIDITGLKTEITTDDDFFWSVNPRKPATLSITFSAGTGGAFAVKNAQGVAERNLDNDGPLVIDFDDTLTRYAIDPSG